MKDQRKETKPVMSETKETKPKTNLPAKREDSPFQIVKADPEQVRDIIQLNLGGAKVTPFKLDRVRVPDGKSDFWTIPTLEDAESDKLLQGVVVHFRDLRAWWPDSEPTGKPPVCRSDDGSKGLGCREHGENYKGDPIDVLHDCRTCKYAQFGSDPKGAGQWCKQIKAVFLIREKTFLPTVLFLPPTSIGKFESYMLRLGSYGVPFNGIVVGFALEKDKNDAGQTYNVAVPKKIRDLSDSEYAAMKAYTQQIRPALETVTIEDDTDYHGGGHAEG